MAARKRMKKGSVVAAEKAKKQKIMLAVLGVLFIGLIAVQGPKTLAMINKKAPADEAHATDHPAGATAAPATTPAAAPTAAPTPTGVPATGVAATAGPAVVAGGIGIADTSGQATPAAGQLISFDTFRTKDPFVPQVNQACAVDASTCPTVATTTPTTPKTPTPPTAGAPNGATPATPEKPTTITPPSPPTSGSAPTEPVKPTSAKLVVNGTEQTVAVDGSFPETDPTFTLVAVTPKAAKIGLVGGSYSTGGATITLKVGKTVTLMNTADGTRYKIKLVSVS